MALIERLKSGGGPTNKDNDQFDELLTVIMENLQPLENIPDDHLDGSDKGSHTHTLSILLHFICLFFLFL